MDLRDSKTQKIIIAVLAFFIVTYFWYSRVYSRFDTQISAKSAEFERVTTKLRGIEMKAKSLDALKLEYTDLIDRYHEIEALLPEVKQIPSLLVQLHRTSSLTGTKISKVEPMPIMEQDFYNVASFRIELSGTYHDFGQFMSYVANYPFIANISGVEIEALNVAIGDTRLDGTNAAELGRKPETINAKFVVSTYFVKEDERLQELTL